MVCDFDSQNIYNFKYTIYVHCRIYTIYVYELKKQVEKRASCLACLTVSANKFYFINYFIITNNVRILYCVYPVMPKSPWTVVIVIVWLFVIQLPMQSVPITATIVISNPAHSEVYRYNIV
jgi:hypothetical protein